MKRARTGQLTRAIFLAALTVAAVIVIGGSGASGQVTDEPVNGWSTLFRFDCRLAAVWHESTKRVAIAEKSLVDGSMSYTMSNSTFESVMWHHVFVSIESNGLATLFVDGFPQATTTVVQSPKTPQGSCSFRMGQNCEDLTSFNGFLDEVAVWNTALNSEINVMDIMMRMPQQLHTNALFVRRNQQIDFTRDRILYVRFNNPCEEIPAVQQISPSPPPPSPNPPPSPSIETTVSGVESRRLLQISDVTSEMMTIADKAMLTDAFAELTLLDQEDPVTVLSYPIHSKYVYTGVPWAAPWVSAVIAPSLSPQSSENVTLTGFAFAKSPFSKCFLKAPQKLRGDSMMDSWSPPLDSERQHKHLPGKNGEGILQEVFVDDFRSSKEFPKMLDSEVTSTNTFEEIQEVSLFQGIIEESAIPNFQTLSSVDALLGSYNTIQCQSPEAFTPFPEYEFGALNDGGYVGSNSVDVEVADLSPKFPGHVNSSMELTSTELQQILTRNSAYTVSFWMWPIGQPSNSSEQIVMSLFSENDIRLQIGISGDQLFYQAANGQRFPIFDNMTMSEEYDQWHFLAVRIESTSQNSEADVYADGNFIYTDIIAGDSAFSFVTPSTLQIGMSYYGYLDEIRLYDTFLNGTELFMSMISSYSSSPEPMGYYRFNEGGSTSTFVSSVEGLEDLSENGGEGPSITFDSLAIPWEPAVITHVNNIPVDILAETFQGKLLGMLNPIKFRGRNFAKSPLLTCSFGATSMIGQLPDLSNGQISNISWPYSQGELLSNAQLSQLYTNADSQNIPLTVYSIAPLPTVSSMKPTFLSPNEIECSPPVVSVPMVGHFGPGNPTLLHTIQFEYLNSAKDCNGSISSSVASIPSLLNGTMGYSIGLWVWPQKTSNSSVVYALEDSSGDHNLVMIMYTQNRFNYFDDCILDVIDSSGQYHAPEMWHYVFVSVESNGDGVFLVDGDIVDEFTTTCKPNGELFTLCAELDPISSSTALHFHGFIDELKIFATSISDVSDIRDVMWNADEAPIPDIYLTFESATMVGNGSSFPDLALTSSPWDEANSFAIQNIDMNSDGSHTIHIQGSNIAPSPFVSVKFDDEETIIDKMSFTLEGSSLVVHRKPSLCSSFTISLTNQRTNPKANPLMMENVVISPTIGDYEQSLAIRSKFTLTGKYIAIGHAYTYPKLGLQIPLLPIVSSGDSNVEGFIRRSDGANITSFSSIYTLGKDDHPMHAIIFGPGLGVEIHISPSTWGASTALKTVSAWIFLLYPESQPPEVELNFTSSEIRFGAWAFVSAITDANGTVTSVYSSYSKANEAEKAFYGDTLLNFLQTGDLLKLSSGSPLNGAIDDLWVWNRQLSHCEVSDFFFTNNYALDVSSSPSSAETVKPFKLPSLHSIYVDAWIRPYSTIGRQSIVSVSSESSQGGNIIELGIQGDRLTASLTTEANLPLPYNGNRSIVSWRSRVLSNKWSHVAMLYSGDALFTFVDGVIKEYITYQSFARISNDTVGKLLIGKGFNGLIAHVSAKTGKFERTPGFQSLISPREVFQESVCPARSFDGMNDLEVALETNEGVGQLLLNTEGINGPVVLNENALWVNASYDAPTSPSRTDIIRERKPILNPSSIARVTVEAHGECGERRRLGGENFTADVIEIATGTSTSAEVIDRNDGAYIMEYMIPKCGLYEVTVKYNDSPLMVSEASFTVELAPGQAVAEMSQVQFPNSTCQAITHEVLITLKDQNGCIVKHHNDSFSVEIVGPGYDGSEIGNEIISPVPGMPGLYILYWRPEKAGMFHIRIALASGAAPGVLYEGCQDVCLGYGLDISNNTLVVVSPPKELSLDKSKALSMSAWIQVNESTTLESNATSQALVANISEGLLPADSYRYIIVKNAPEDIGWQTSTYDLKISTGLNVLVCSIYIGFGEYRIAAAPINLQANQWHSLAAAYDGKSIALYLDGLMLTKRTYSELESVEGSDYVRPLTIGYMFEGMIDEVAIYDGALSPTSMIPWLICPAFAQPANAVAYFSFNEEQESVESQGFISGYSIGCSDIRIDCLEGTITGNSIQTSPPEQTTTFFPAMGFSSFTYPQQPTTDGFSLELRTFDACGYPLPLDSSGMPLSLGLKYSRTTVQWFNDGHDSLEYPVSSIVEVALPSLFDHSGYLCTNTNPSDKQGNSYVFSNLVLPMAHEKYMVSATAGSTIIMTKTIKVDPGAVTFIQLSPPTSAESGVSVSIKLTANDIMGSPVSGVPTVEEAAITFSDPVSYAFIKELDDMDKGTFYLTFVPLQTGQYTIASSKSSTAASIGVTGKFREIVPVHMTIPEQLIRFHHSSFSYGNDFYIYGGADKSKNYLQDMWKLSEAKATGFGFRLKKGLSQVPPVNETIAFSINTAMLIDQGQLKSDCSDILFVANEDILPFYVHSWKKCGQVDTKFLVRVPGDTKEIYIYHGNAAHSADYSESFKGYNGIFQFYAGFENNSMDGLTSMPTCSLPSNRNAFAVVKEGTPDMSMALRGSFALKSESAAGVIGVHLKENLTNFVMSAWLYDSDAVVATHFISPNFRDCEEIGGDITLLPADISPSNLAADTPDTRSTAVGTYSYSIEDQFAVASPWEKSGIIRKAAWHYLEIKSSDAGTVITINGTVVKSSTSPITADRVFISSATVMGTQMSSFALWDEIIVIDMPREEIVSISLRDSVDYLPYERKWTEVVSPSPAKPTPRVGHSTVVIGSSMFLFGGERSAYFYGDLWKYDLVTGLWTFLSASGDGPAARFGHSAVSLGSKMVIFGGKGNSSDTTYFDDIWEFDTITEKWSLIGKGPSGRFGHGAAVTDGIMYIFGGFGASGKFLNDMYSFDFTFKLLSTIPVSSQISARFSVSMTACGSKVFLFGGETIDDSFWDVWELNVVSGIWTFLGSLGQEGRSAASARLANKLIVQGGYVDMKYSSYTYTFPLPCV